MEEAWAVNRIEVNLELKLEVKAALGSKNEEERKQVTHLA